MTKEECFELGFVARTHGLIGEVGVELDVDDPARYQDLEMAFLEIKNQLVPFMVEYCAFHNDKLLIKFEDVDDVDGAGKLTGTKLFLPLEKLPDLGDDQYYYHELVGMEVVDHERGVLGKVENIYSANAHSLMSLQYKGKEVLVPIQDEIVQQVDKQEGKVTVVLPTGLLELYLED